MLCFFLDAPSIPTRTPHMPNTWKLGVAHSPYMVHWAVPPPFLVSHLLLVGIEAGGPAMAWPKLPWPWERKHQESTSNRWSKCPKTPLILLKKWKNGKFWPMATGCQMELVPEKMVCNIFFFFLSLSAPICCRICNIFLVWITYSSENLNFTPNDDHFRKVKYFHLYLNILSFNLSKVLWKWKT